MRYVVGGYAFVLFVLSLYAVQLVLRRRRLAAAAAHAAEPAPAVAVGGADQVAP